MGQYLSILSNSKSCAILAATAFHTWTKICNYPIHTLHITFASIVFTSLIGVKKWHKNQNRHIEQIFKYGQYFQLSFALPCLTSSVLLKIECDPVLAYAWMFFPILPFFYYFKKAKMDNEVDESLNELSAAPLLLLWIKEENYYGVGCVMSYQAGRFCLKYGEHFLERNVALGNYFFCLFVYLTVKAVEKTTKDSYPIDFFVSSA